MYKIDIIPWDENFNTGLHIIDVQHQKLVEIINELAAKLAFPSSDTDLDTVFNDLIEYTNYHFESEEAVWHKYLNNHKTEENHKKTHIEFIDNVKALIEEQHGESAQEIAENTLSFLVEWLVSHILESDRYLAYLVTALQEGEDFDKAVMRAEISMSGYNSQMIEMIKKIYKSLANNTLKLMHEIKEQRSTQQRLKLSDERLAHALSGTSDGLWDWNLETDSVYYSARWFSMLGYQENELGRTLDTWVALVHPNDKDKSLKVIEDHINSNSTNFEMEFRMRHKDGHWVFILSRGSLMRDNDGKTISPRRIIGTHVDISKQKETERLLLDSKEELNNYKNQLEQLVEKRTKELKEAKEKAEEATEESHSHKGMYELAFNSSGDGILIIEDNKFVECNKAITKMLNYNNKDELLHTHPSELSPELQPDGRSSKEKADEMMDKARKNGHHTFEWVHQTSDKEPIWIDVSLTPMTYHGKDIIYTVWRDIDAKKRVEAELIKAKEKAEEATKAKTEFLANMSHEIRTPMNSVIGMTSLALQTDLNDKQKNYISKANIAANNLLIIINDILDFSKIEAGKLELSSTHFELKEIIGNTLHLISVAAKDKDLSTRVKLDKSVPKFYFADSLRLGQVLTNLASNAVKFSHKKGSVTLAISLQEENDTDAIVQFSVIDEGIGIPPEAQKRLFQSFSQADGSIQRKFGGTGLGLAISKKIVELMDGEIWVKSEEGKGSTFSFRVKMQKSHLGAITQSSEDTKVVMKHVIERLQNKHVLLVEDNEMNQELAIDLLERNGLNVTLAVNGQKALDTLHTNSFDLVLMDVQMPIMDGYTATKKIREHERFRDLPIIAMTANVLSADIAKAKEAGMNDHIAKPIVPNDMFVTMVKWIKE